MSNNTLTQDDLNKLKEFLPFGSQGKIAKKIGVSRETVKQVLAGTWYNADVITEAYKIAEAEKNRRNALSLKIKNFINA